MTSSSRCRARGLVVALAVLAGCTTTPQEGPTGTAPEGPAPTAALDPVAHAAALVEGSNAARVARGLAPLRASTCAEGAAAVRAADLVGSPELEHAPMDPVLRDCDVARAAENLSRADAPAADVVAAWLDSPGHRDNLLDPGLVAVGVACAPDDGALLCSEVFLGP